MREYYDLWERFTRGLGRKGKLKEGLRRRSSTRGSLPAHAQRHASRRPVEDDPGAAAALRRHPERAAVPAGTRAAVSNRRLRRLRVRGFAAASAEAARSAGRGRGQDEGRLARREDRGRRRAGPALRERIRALGLEGRVELLGAIDDAALLDHYARCRAVCFAPQNEDYGFVTLEAFRSGKAVLTASDSGGPAELVQNGVSGWVTAPTPESMALALDELAADRSRRERLGGAGLAAAREHTWERAVARLID
jgi:hypothetical protein